MFPKFFWHKRIKQEVVPEPAATPDHVEGGKWRTATKKTFAPLHEVFIVSRLYSLHDYQRRSLDGARFEVPRSAFLFHECWRRQDGETCTVAVTARGQGEPGGA